MSADPEEAIRAIYSLEFPRLIAGLVRIVRDVDVAEEIARDALVSALEQWPEAGVPDNPAAWLRTTAKNRAINYFRRGKMLERKHAELGHMLESTGTAEHTPQDIEAALDDNIGDDLLRLVFTACHTVLSTE